MTDENAQGDELDLGNGVALSRLVDGEPLAGKVGDDDVVVVRRGEKIFAVGASCTHYGGPLKKGLVVGETIRCPWHHAAFDLKTGRAVGAPAFASVGCYPVEVDGDEFRVLEKSEPEEKSGPKRAPESVVIVGAGAAAAAAAEMLRQEGYAGPVTMIGAEKSGPVDRPNLSKDYLAGEAEEDWIPLGGYEHWRGLDVEVVTGQEVVDIDRSEKSVRTSAGKTYDYDVLLYATGAEPVVPPVEGLEDTSYFTLRSFQDSQDIVEAAEEAESALILGAGFIGLEVAASLRNRGVEVSVVAPDTVPLERVLGEELGAFVQSLHEEEGVTFYLDRSVERFEANQAHLSDGTALSFDFVVLGTGVKPRTELAEKVGLDVDDGVIVDGELKTNDEFIYAAGDVARYPDPQGGESIRVEHWVLAERLAQRAARNMLGVKNLGVTDVPFFWSRHYDLTINYVGHALEFDEVIVDGRVSDRDAAVGYVKDGEIQAVATLGRAITSLKAEEALADGDQERLKQLFG